MSNVTKPARPYTEYNIFFQLEREYILQISLGFQPDLDTSDVFDASDSALYHGPPLPSRYTDLVLPNDWHVPGKEKRRKRRHRKSHGKIGFHQLSLKIAEAWKTVDNETRIFCANVCDIGLSKYKNALREYKQINETNVVVDFQPDALDIPHISMRKKSKVADVSKALDKSLDKLEVNDESVFRISLSSESEQTVPLDSDFEKDLEFYFNNFDQSMSNVTLESDDGLKRSYADSFVDIDDDEIISMWISEPETVGSTAFSSPSLSGNNGVGSVIHPRNLIDDEQEVFAWDQQSCKGKAPSEITFCSFIDANKIEPSSIISSSSVAGHLTDSSSFMEITLDDIKNMRQTLLQQYFLLQQTAQCFERDGIRPRICGYAARSA